jgi:type II secretory pathway component PulC
MKLSAIIITDTERSALLMPTGGSQSERVKEGETVSGWEVLKINDDSVVIRSRGQEQTLTLRDFGPPGAVPQRPAKPSMQQGNGQTARKEAAEQLRELRQRAAERAKAPPRTR